MWKLDGCMVKVVNNTAIQRLQRFHGSEMLLWSCWEHTNNNTESDSHHVFSQQKNRNSSECLLWRSSQSLPHSIYFFISTSSSISRSVSTYFVMSRYKCIVAQTHFYYICWIERRNMIANATWIIVNESWKPQSTQIRTFMDNAVTHVILPFFFFIFISHDPTIIYELWYTTLSDSQQVEYISFSRSRAFVSKKKEKHWK